MVCFEDCLCSVAEDGQECDQITAPPPFASPSPSPFSNVTASPTPEETVYGRSASPVSYATGSPSGYDGCRIFPNQKTLWYQLPRNDENECVRARLGGGGYATMVVFSGECGDYSCVDASSYYSNSDQQLIWEVKPGVTYYVVVIGSGYGDEVEFSLDFEPVTCLENDSCESSTEITNLPFVDVTKNIEMASRVASTSARTCSESFGYSRGVWYSVIGTGECLR